MLALGIQHTDLRCAYTWNGHQNKWTPLSINAESQNVCHGMRVSEIHSISKLLFLFFIWRSNWLHSVIHELGSVACSKRRGAPGKCPKGKISLGRRAEQGSCKPKKRKGLSQTSSLSAGGRAGDLMQITSSSSWGWGGPITDSLVPLRKFLTGKDCISRGGWNCR